MLDMKFIRQNKETVLKAIADKQMTTDLDQLFDLDQKVHDLKIQQQDLQTERNLLSKKIPKAPPEERAQLIKKSKDVGTKLDDLKPDLQKYSDLLQDLLYRIPQIPAKDVPIGVDENDNVVVKEVGKRPEFDFIPRDHVELLELNQWADFKHISEVSGSRSYSLRNEMVFLELALHQLAMNKLMAKGFTLVSAPSFAREAAFIGTGHFPDARDQVYHLTEDNIYLSGTAEVQINSLHGKTILSEEDLPILYAGYSPCFRREAGSYGKDVRGLIRVHQFMKVEQYVICRHDENESKKWHQTLLETSEEIMHELELPYRVIECCTGDMGAGKVKMHDIEAWVPSEEKYRETHSCSTLHDWQARRTQTRYRDKDGQVLYCHTLNNTAIATPRILVPLLENHQTKEGKLHLVKALRPFFAGRETL